MVKQCILGIDVGTSAVKVLAAEVGEDNSLEIRGSGIVPSTGLNKGNIVDMPSLANTINQAVDCALMAADISAAKAFVGLGGNAMRCYNSIGSIAPALPAFIEKSDIEKACRAAALTTVPEDYAALDIIPTSFWVDGNRTQHQPTGEKGSRLEVEVHIAAIPQTVYTDVKALLTNAGIEVAGISANAVAVSAVIPTLHREACLCIDIGAGLTDIALYHKGDIRLSASLPLGGDYITNDIMQGLGIGRGHAEEIKRYYGKLDSHLLRGKDILLDCNGYGTTDKKVSYDFLQDIVESRIHEIVSLTHQYLAPALTAYNPQQIFLTGGCSQMPSLIAAYQQIFSISSNTLAPDTTREYAHPSNTACFGLLQTGIEKIAVKPIVASSQPGIFNKLKNMFKTGNRG